ncbi:MAG: DUF6249 domain-containing protein [bacterium]
MVAAIIVAIVFISLVTVIKMFLDNAVKKRLIEKGMVDENVKYLHAMSFQNQVPSSLKWGIVLIAIGSAVLFGQLAPYSMQEEVTASGMLIMAGLALIAYYFIANRLFKDRAETKSQ